MHYSMSDLAGGAIGFVILAISVIAIIKRSVLSSRLRRRSGGVYGSEFGNFAFAPAVIAVVAVLGAGLGLIMLCIGLVGGYA